MLFILYILKYNLMTSLILSSIINITEYCKYYNFFLELVLYLYTHNIVNIKLLFKACSVQQTYKCYF